MAWGMKLSLSLVVRARMLRSSMGGSSVLVMCWGDFTTLCKALRFRAVQLPYQAVMQPVRRLSMTPSPELTQHRVQMSGLTMGHQRAKRSNTARPCFTGLMGYDPIQSTRSGRLLGERTWLPACVPDHPGGIGWRLKSGLWQQSAVCKRAKSQSHACNPSPLGLTDTLRSDRCGCFHVSTSDAPGGGPVKFVNGGDNRGYLAARPLHLLRWPPPDGSSLLVQCSL
ncbi:unnamed protein product [Pleuronectes platessa]|uniref:Secreted protein n=1 Tax=Pleuronectes platessa TaxID=8262 RepID=A0A9N7UX64_PLEPL|nr:unnamed protein product [Pleuronectes platessa]